MRIALGTAGSLAIESPVLVWVADHRRARKYSDKEGDPHSPWRFGTGGRAVAVTALSTMAGNEMGVTGRDSAVRLWPAVRLPGRLQIALEPPQRTVTCTGLEQMAAAAVARSLISAVLPANGLFCAPIEQSPGRITGSKYSAISNVSPAVGIAGSPGRLRRAVTG